MAQYLDHTGQLTRLTHHELMWCLRLNRAAHRPGWERLFAVISRLGDGIFWYGLMGCLLLVQGLNAVPALGRMLLTGLVCLILYKWLKAKTTRPRPYARHTSIKAAVAPLDQYSFPSGHTLHAVAFTVVAIAHYPQLAWLLLPFSLLVALSRLVLGLHYPSDVLAGALLGVGISISVLQF